MIIDILPRSRYPEWDAYVEKEVRGSIYHTSQWLFFIEKTYGHRPMVVVAKDENNEVIGGIPGNFVNSRLFGRRFSSVPCAQQCTPIGRSTDVIVSILSYIEKQLKTFHMDRFELRMDRAGIPEELVIIKNTNLEFCSYVLSLNRDFNTLSKGFHNDCVKRAVARSRKSGVEIREATSRADIQIFYNIYCQMRKEKGLLPQPMIFFLNLWDIFRPGNLIEVFHAIHEGIVISSIILLKSKKTIIYEYGATVSEKKKLNPNSLLLWHAIEKACAEGYTVFDFGRCSVDDDGLKTFKSRWATQYNQLYYYSIPEESNAMVKSKKQLKYFMNLIVRNLPLPFLRLTSKLIYSQIT
jgi:hypothetical protein